MRDGELCPCVTYCISQGETVPEKDKLDKPSQIEFAEAITANIPEVDRSVFAGTMGTIAAYYVATRMHKNAKRK